MKFSIQCKRAFSSLFLLVSLAATTSASMAQAGRGPSTEEERTRVVQLALKAEKDPLAVIASPDAKWFQKWADEIPDYSFGPDRGAFWLMTGAAKGTFKKIMEFQHFISTAAYQVQHGVFDPQKNTEAMEAKTLAGVEGILRTYENMLPKFPDIRSEKMEDAIKHRNEGSLAQFVKALPPMPSR